MRTLLSCPVQLVDGTIIRRNVVCKRWRDTSGTIEYKRMQLTVDLVEHPEYSRFAVVRSNVPLRARAARKG